MKSGRERFSRFQVLCAEREAWLEGGASAGHDYYYDGVSFWRLLPDGTRRLLPSWRTPGHGWHHAEGCTCELCAAPQSTDARSLSVA
ncbi:MAG TPA: hypothetical protein PLJ89_07610 [Thermoleophilia bacterium]|nr:hypothetical protein [Acidobacteriota bacterium]HOU28763.1 hypothetical protein [Thermoleophilia bacterium]HQF52776.1 hypothetical protein [Thermoleophilia bacterium]HQH21948.1 hypothetical protein [Thermoleophilia bacterium]HQJ26648.1 hypothetical protein [Thermoleophilia bacterium]